MTVLFLKKYNLVIAVVLKISIWKNDAHTSTIFSSIETPKIIKDKNENMLKYWPVAITKFIIDNPEFIRNCPVNMFCLFHADKHNDYFYVNSKTFKEAITNQTTVMIRQQTICGWIIVRNYVDLAIMSNLYRSLVYCPAGHIVFVYSIFFPFNMY